MRLALAAAAVLLAAVPGASAGQAAALRIVSLDRPVFSPNGNGVNDTVTVRTNAAPGTLLGLRVYAWGGRLSGWRRIRTGVSSTSPDVTWDGSTASGGKVRDGTYQVTVCYKDQGRPLPPLPVPVRPGAAEVSVRRPPWRTSGCAAARVVRVERLAAYVDSTGSFHQGDRIPLVVSADKGQYTVGLERDCRASSEVQMAFSDTGSVTVPFGDPPGLYHAVAGDPAGDEFRAPVVVRDRRPLDRPAPHTALVVWPYLTWRAYNAYDADLNGIPDSWYQFWRQRSVSLVGPILRDGVEDDHKAAAPFSRWLCSRSVRAQHVTDVELGRLPLSTLRRYAAIVFPGHSEYYEPRTYDLLKRYRDGGGNLVFLLANPFYRQVRLESGRNAVVLTDYDAREGRSDFALAGVGYDGCCFPRSRGVPYVAATGSDFRRVRWLFRGLGIGPGQSFGWAASESDRVDPDLSPRDRVTAGRAIIRGKRGVVDASMVWSHAGRGSVFATGNYTFLRMSRGLTYRLLDNVWRRLVG
ncbi:MAG TPA: N,N-dimethylformamidase beta subunit family domain-containing protein [Gaiellaceae bacterium]|nr:N,N-dimethylformamidase beta subunit family domain-containing protein [Gaiellaceae bacterium]